MELQIEFTDPLYISMAETSDTLQIQIIDTSYFKNSKNVEIEKSRYSLELPYQMIQSASTNSFILGAKNL
jgi:hypothetical protein